MEILPVVVTIKKHVYTLCLIYRPPNVDEQHDNKILDFIQSLSCTPNIVILGGLNLPDVCWDGYYGVSDCSQAFANLAYNLNLTQLVSRPTHCAGNIECGVNQH